MKKSAITLLTFAVAVFTASCQKENISEQIAEYTPMTINAVANGIDIPATKTSLAFKFDVNWNESDKIYVTDGSNSNAFTLSGGAGTPKGLFTQDGEGKTFTGEVEAYYPSSMVGGEIKGSVILDWPADQKNDQTIPMYCKTTLTSSGQGAQRMDFTSLGSVLRIAFTTPVSDIKLKSITIKDDETKMSRLFTVENGKAIISETDGTNSITLDLGDDGVDVSNKINYFNIAVPAGHYQKFSITFTATDGKQCVMTGGNFEIKHNTVGTLSLTGKEFKAPKPDIAPEGFVDIGVAVGGDKIYFTESPMGASDPWEVGYYCILTINYTTSEIGVTQRYVYPSSTKENASIPSNTRMPTKEEYEALASAVNAGAGTTWFWVNKKTSNPTTYDTWGGWAYVPEGATPTLVAYAPDMNGGYIGIEASEFDKIKFFIPAAGGYNTYGTYSSGSNFYWSSTISNGYVYYLSFFQNGISVESTLSQSKGYPTLLVYKTSE